MNYSDILKALPIDVAEALQQQLDTMELPQDVSREKIKLLVQDAVEAVKADDRVLHIADKEKKILISMLLSAVPTAAVEALFN